MSARVFYSADGFVGRLCQTPLSERRFTETPYNFAAHRAAATEEAPAEGRERNENAVRK
jgi:hypothetical protein